MKHKIFVYGILVDRYENQRPALLRGYRKELHGFYTIIKDPQSVVKSYVIEVDDDELQRIDRIEGYPHYYRRFRVDVETEIGTERVWVYKMNEEHRLGNTT